MTTPTWESIADKALDKASNVFDATGNVVSNAIDQYGQTAVDATLFIVRIDLVKDLVTGILLLLVLVGFLFLIIHERNNLIEKPLRKPTDDDVGETQKERDSEVWCLSASIWALATLFSAVTVFSPINKIFNPWTYIGIAKPELWIAKQVYDKALNTVTDIKK